MDILNPIFNITCVTHENSIVNTIPKNGEVNFGHYGIFKDLMIDEMNKSYNWNKNEELSDTKKNIILSIKSQRLRYSIYQMNITRLFKFLQSSSKEIPLHCNISNKLYSFSQKVYFNPEIKMLKNNVIDEEEKLDDENIDNIIKKEIGNDELGDILFEWNNINQNIELDKDKDKVKDLIRYKELPIVEQNKKEEKEIAIESLNLIKTNIGNYCLNRSSII